MSFDTSTFHTCEVCKKLRSGNNHERCSRILQAKRAKRPGPKKGTKTREITPYEQEVIARRLTYFDR